MSVISIAPMIAAFVATQPVPRIRNHGYQHEDYSDESIKRRIRSVTNQPDKTDISHAVTSGKANLLLNELYKIVKKQGYGINYNNVEGAAVEFNISSRDKWEFGKFKELEETKSPDGREYGPFIYDLTYYPENFFNDPCLSEYYHFFFKMIVVKKETVAAELIGFNVVYADEKAFELRKYYDTFITHTPVNLAKLIEFCKAAGRPDEVIDKQTGVRTNGGIFNKIINLVKRDNEST